MTVLDSFASNWSLPIGGMLISIFCGWFLTKEEKRSELHGKELVLYSTWNFTIRYISPLLVFIVILNKIGLIKL